ncbi:MAG TPA: nuclease-related domain-containing protein [Acidimicrobiales bacterium]|nr:nuclease-related domain-containing protein [Acidimicrobiales bacterium]
MPNYGRARPGNTRGGLFDPGNVRSGDVGEASTRRHLEAAFGADSSVHVFHNLSVPGAKADIDHAVLRGDTLVVVDSKHWKPGFYWTIAGKTFRGFERFPYADRRGTSMAVDHLRKLLPGVKVSGITVVWSRGGRASLGLAHDASGARFCPGPELGEALRKRFRGAATVPNVSALRLLSGLMR